MLLGTYSFFSGKCSNEFSTFPAGHLCNVDQGSCILPIGICCIWLCLFLLFFCGFFFFWGGGLLCVFDCVSSPILPGGVITGVKHNYILLVYSGRNCACALALMAIFPWIHRSLTLRMLLPRLLVFVAIYFGVTATSSMWAVQA